MATTVTTSKQFSLNISDFGKGLIMAILLPVFTIVLDSINHGSLVFDWKLIGGAAIAGALAYLTKNFFTPTAIVIKDPAAKSVQDVDKGNATVHITTPH